MGKFALLLSGGVNAQINFTRYKNDLEWVYRTLVDDCQYTKSDIAICYSDGRGLKYRNESVGTMPAEKNRIISYLEKVACETTEQDVFLLVVSNHGDHAYGGCINMWGDEVLEFDKLAVLLNAIPAQKIIILGECYAGNFLNWEIKDSCVITANERGEQSYTHPLQKDYDELIKHFFSFIHKAYPDGTLIPSGENDVKKAYEYAKENDAFRPGADCQRLLGVTEIPQMKCNVVGKVCL